MINDRINRLITILEMNPTSFSESIGVNVTVIFNIIKGRRSKPSFDLLFKILHTYQNLNAEWLTRGEGEMWDEDLANVENVTPSYQEIEERIASLLSRLKIEVPESYELYELEELVTFVLEESNAQKSKLILLNERQEQMLNILREKLKIKI